MIKPDVSLNIKITLNRFTVGEHEEDQKQVKLICAISQDQQEVTYVAGTFVKLVAASID